MSRNYLSRLIIIVDKNNNPLMTSIRSICNFNLKTPAIGKYGSLYHHFGGTKVHAHGLNHDINSVIQFVTIFKMKHWKIEIRIILKTQFKQKRNYAGRLSLGSSFFRILDDVLQKDVEYQKVLFQRWNWNRYIYSYVLLQLFTHQECKNWKSKSWRPFQQVPGLKTT